MPGLVSAQGSPTATNLTIHHIDASKPPRVLVYASVWDAQGNPVRGLDKTQFQLQEDSAPVEIANVSRAGSPLAVVVAIDTSGSMKDEVPGGETGMNAAKAAANLFIEGLQDGDEVAVLQFDEEIAFTLPQVFVAYRDRNLLRNRVNYLAAQTRNTRLYDAAYSACSAFAQPPRFRRAVLLLSDGGNNWGDLRKLEVAMAMVERTGVPIFTVGFGPAPDNEALRALAASTGGRLYTAKSAEALRQAFQTINSLLREEYLLEYVSPGSQGDHTLALGLKGGLREVQAEKKFKMPPLPPEFALDLELLEEGVVFEPKFLPQARPSIAKVEYYIDEAPAPAYIADIYPYQFHWGTSQAAPGRHSVSVRAYNVAGQSVDQSREIIVPERPWWRRLRNWDMLPLVVLAGVMAVGVAAVTLWWLGILLPRPRPASILSSSVPPHIEVSSGAGGTTRDVSVETPTKLVIGDAVGKLRVLKGLDAGLEYEVRSGDRIGRSSDCAIRLTDEEVSRIHAEIVAEGDNPVLKHVGRNDTRVNGVLVSGQGNPLRHGDEVSLANRTVVMLFERIEPQEAERGTVAVDPVDPERTQPM